MGRVTARRADTERGGGGARPTAPSSPGDWEGWPLPATGGRRWPFGVGDAADAIGGLGCDVMMSGRLMAMAQSAAFVEALHSALLGTGWADRHGRRWSCTTRCAGDIAAATRGFPEDDYRSFEGPMTGCVEDGVRAEFRRLGWEQLHPDGTHAAPTAIGKEGRRRS